MITKIRKRTKNLLVLHLTFFSWTVIAGAQAEVSWIFTANKTTDKTFEVRMTANVKTGWHIYSQTTPAGGPLATRISFSKNPLIIASAGVKEIGKLSKRFEKVFDVDVHYYDNKVEFVQVFRLKTNVKTTVQGTIEYMVCNDEECLPPAKVSFNVKLQ